MDGRVWKGGVESYGFAEVLSFRWIFGCDWSCSCGFDGLVVERLGLYVLFAAWIMVRTRRSEGMQ